MDAVSIDNPTLIQYDGRHRIQLEPINPLDLVHADRPKTLIHNFVIGIRIPHLLLRARDEL